MVGTHDLPLPLAAPESQIFTPRKSRHIWRLWANWSIRSAEKNLLPLKTANNALTSESKRACEHALRHVVQFRKARRTVCGKTTWAHPAKIQRQLNILHPCTVCCITCSKKTATNAFLATQLPKSPRLETVIIKRRSHSGLSLCGWHGFRDLRVPLKRWYLIDQATSILAPEIFHQNNLQYCRRRNP